MATSKKKAGSQAVAIELMKADHRKVEELFERYDSEKEGDEDALHCVIDKDLDFTVLPTRR